MIFFNTFFNFNLIVVNFLWILKVENLWNFPYYNFLELSKLEMFEIFDIIKFWNCPNREVNNRLDYFNLQNQNLALKIGDLRIVHPFDLPHYSQFCQFSYLPFDINQFSQFLFPILVTRKFVRSTFERSLIFKFVTSAILKFYCSKF